MRQQLAFYPLPIASNRQPAYGSGVQNRSSGEDRRHRRETKTSRVVLVGTYRADLVAGVVSFEHGTGLPFDHEPVYQPPNPFKHLLAPDAAY